MTRRAAAGLARMLPILLIAAALATLTGAALLAACGGSAGGSSPQPTATVTVTPGPSETPGDTASPSASASPAQTTLRLYFVRDGKLGVAERRVARTTMPATAAVQALLGGPTAEEQNAGLSTSLTPGVTVDSLSIDGGVARVDLSPELGDPGEVLDEAGGGLPAAQVVYTLTQFPTVRRVAITVDGTPYPAAEDAGSSSGEWRRRDFAGHEPAIFVETPGVGAVVSSPFTLAGTAMVFEGSFLARLTDSSGRRVVQVVMQASRGAPERGRFGREVPFSTSAPRGTLIVYAQSMEDGSRQDEVRIPVTFAP